ncbi:hypothetical protein [Paenibacillus sp.]|jgi:hypothetical protein|nr:hypothetical protein [Paenibacillus sp.]
MASKDADLQAFFGPTKQDENFWGIRKLSAVVYDIQLRFDQKNHR